MCFVKSDFSAMEIQRTVLKLSFIQNAAGIVPEEVKFDEYAALCNSDAFIEQVNPAIKPIIWERVQKNVYGTLCSYIL